MRRRSAAGTCTGALAVPRVAATVPSPPHPSAHRPRNQCCPRAEGEGGGTLRGGVALQVGPDTPCEFGSGVAGWEVYAQVQRCFAASPAVASVYARVVCLSHARHWLAQELPLGESKPAPQPAGAAQRRAQGERGGVGAEHAADASAGLRPQPQQHLQRGAAQSSVRQLRRRCHAAQRPGAAFRVCLTELGGSETAERV
jgi:hypothetical protein